MLGQGGRPEYNFQSIIVLANVVYWVTILSKFAWDNTLTNAQFKREIARQRFNLVLHAKYSKVFKVDTCLRGLDIFLH